MVIVNTTNGIERQHRTMKEGFLQGVRDKTLTGMLEAVTKEFLVSEQSRLSSLALHNYTHNDIILLIQF